MRGQEGAEGEFECTVWQAFTLPYFFALSDQIGVNISGLLYLRRREGAWLKAFSRY